MKKRFVMFICALLILAVLAGCSGGGTAEPATEPTQATTSHSHIAQEGWEYSGKMHWQLCECGEKLNAADHSLAEDLICTVCGVEVCDYGDGSADVIVHDAYGNMERYLCYDQEDNLISSDYYEREYDGAGNVLLEKNYSNDQLRDMSEYVVGEDGESQIVSYTYYQESGEYSVSQYDEYGDIVHWVQCAPDGTILYEDLYEYAFDDEGNRYKAKYSETYEDGQSLLAHYNSLGDITYRAMYLADGTLDREDVWEYGYNEADDALWQKQYSNGILVYEIVNYAEVTNEDYSMRYPEVVIYYNEDGSKLVETNGTDGNVASEVGYLADGTVSFSRAYVREYDEEGQPLRVQTFENDRLISDEEYAIHSEYGWSYLAKCTEYQEDGGCTVSEYDENEALVSQTQYDAQGNVIP